MKIFYKKYKIGILILIYLSVMGVFGYYSVRPAVQKINDLADQIQKKIVDNQKSQERISQIPRMDNAYKEYLAKKDSLVVILNDNQAVDFIKKIESTAENTGNEIEIKINEVYEKEATKTSTPNQPGKKDEEKSLVDKLAYGRYLPIQATIRGSYQSLANFLNKIENDQYFVNVTSLQMKESTEMTSNVNLNTDIFQAINQLSEEEKNKPAPTPVAKQVVSGSLNMIVYLKK